MGLRDRQRSKIAESAERFIEPGEEIEFAVAGQLWMKPRVIVGTNAAVYVMKGSVWSVTKSTGVELRVPLEEAALSLKQTAKGPRLQIQGEYARLGSVTPEDLERIRALAERTRSPAS